MLAALLLMDQLNEFSLKANDKGFVLNGPRGELLRAAGKDPVSAGISESSQPCAAVLLGYPHGPKDSQFVPAGAQKKTVEILAHSRGEITFRIPASRNAIRVIFDDRAVLGSSFGEAQDSRHNAIYDRDSDQLIVWRDSKAALRRKGAAFEVSCSGFASVEVKPDYVRNHLGYFLWDNKAKLWPKPVAGWCSWMAHLQRVTEDDVRKAARFFSENLLDYGYDVIQMDDGFQRVPQSGEPPLKPGAVFSELWTQPNEKFPSGLAALARDIREMGMTPGIWVGLYLPLGLRHSEGYVAGKDGKPLRGPWVNYAMNGLMPEPLDEAYLKTIRDLKAMGWRYFKIDTLRHVLYDNYRLNPDYWRARGQSPEKAFRAIMTEIKGTAGRDIYVLACWGALPELAGLPDGCRIGEDVGPDLASMRRSAKYIAQFHHLNNVVWRNDPDYMCLRLPAEQAEAWVTLTALAGGHLMVSDPPESYDANRLELLRRVGPPMLLKPQSVRQMPPDPEFFTLAAAKGGESWHVAARFAWTDKAPSAPIPAEMLGMSSDKDYLAFDFWRAEFLGVVRGAARFRSLDPGHTQAIAFRPLLAHPQVLGTDRHIGQGVVELEAVKWDGTSLSGRLLRGKGARWSVFIHVPDGWEVLRVEPKGADYRASKNVLRLTLPEGTGMAYWRASFGRREQRASPRS